MFQVTRGGMACSSILLGSRAGWLEQHAAEELRSYVRKISGAVLNIMHEQEASSVSGNKILIGMPGTCDLIGRFEKEHPGLLPKESGTENDCIAYAVRDEVLVISGSNRRSVYYSVCHLLQTEWKVGFYWDQDVYEKEPDLFLQEGTTLRERSDFKIRHSIGQWVYNYGAFLNAKERRQELDKLARNKINSYRLYNWNSYARKKTFLELGLTGIRITGEDLARRDIVRDTIGYAQSLGMEVMVPLLPDETSPEFRSRYPDARYFGTEWVKNDASAPQPVPCLYPEDPMYRKLIQTFAKVWTEAYGPAVSFVCAPPTEHHIYTDVEDFIEINVNFARYTYEALHEVIPSARLFYDGWGVRANTPPSIWSMPGVVQRFADNLPEEVFFLDLWPDRAEFGENYMDPLYRDVHGRPLRKAHYVLEALNEFGGDDHLHGNFRRYIEAAQELTKPSVAEHGDGFGNCSELCGVSLHFFDLIFQLAWKPENMTLDRFLDDSARRRYGNLPAETGKRAMRDLEQAVYSDRSGSHPKYQKRCYLSRPQRNFVPMEKFRQTVEHLGDFMRLMTALPDEKKTGAVGRDMYDVMRQYIAEYFNMHLGGLLNLFVHRGTEKERHPAFELHASVLEALLNQLEVMTRENPEMYIETIVRRLADRPADPDISAVDCAAPKDFRAWMRDMGTTFVRSIPNLPDYASQDYHELICYYYHPRMTACIETLRSFLDDDGETAPSVVDEILESRYREVENHWIDVGYPVTDECEEAHLPLWRAAQNAWTALQSLPFLNDLARENGTEAEKIAAVPECVSEGEPKERSWVAENPFATEAENPN